MKRFRNDELDAYDEDDAFRHVLELTDVNVAAALGTPGAGNFSRGLGIPEELLRVTCGWRQAYATAVLFARAHGLVSVETSLVHEFSRFALQSVSYASARLAGVISELEFVDLVLGKSACMSFVKTGFILPTDMLHQYTGRHAEPGYVEVLDKSRLLLATDGRMSLRFAPLEVGDYTLTTVDLNRGVTYVERRVGLVVDEVNHNYLDALAVVDVD